MINVLDPGFFTTVQDLGRHGFQHFGVPVSGVMDLYSMHLANSVLGNTADMAVLEMTLKGPKLQFDYDSVICISGGEMSAKVNDSAVLLHHPTIVHAGDVISFGKLQYGVRTYLAVRGGLKSEQIMGSRSMCYPVTSNPMIFKGDSLPIDKIEGIAPSAHAFIKIDSSHFDSDSIDVHEGPEFKRLSKDQQHNLLTNEFTISKNNNRMAYQLNEYLENNIKPIITSPVLAGTVQLTPSGKLIILMRDCQTTGGYPRVLQLDSNAINKLSQKFTAQQIKFKKIQKNHF